MIADPTRYITIYDETLRCVPNWGVLKPAAVIFLAGVVLVALPLPLGRLRRQARYSGILMLLGTVGWAMLAGATAWRGERTLCQAMRTGQFTVVEGVVRNFQPAVPRKRRIERWDVESGGRAHHYSYSPADLGGYRQTAPEGGRIREGTHVRIADADGVIGRLEIAVEDTGHVGPAK